MDGPLYDLTPNHRLYASYPRGLHLGDVDVEVADRAGLELALRLFVSRDLGQGLIA